MSISNLNTSDEKYWAAYPDPKKAVSAIETKRKEYYTWLNTSGRRLLLQRTWIFYNLAAIIGPTIQKMGTKGQYNMFLINEMRSLLQQQFQIITGTRPVWDPRATNDDSKALKECRIARNVLDYYMRSRNFEEDLTAAIEIAGVTGEAYYEVKWDARGGKKLKHTDAGYNEIAKRAGITADQMISGDVPDIYEGDIASHLYSGYDVARDVHATRVEDTTWKIARRKINKYDLAARYPEKAKEILAMSYDSATEPIEQYRLYYLRSWASDDVLLCTFYHEKTDALPNGRELIYLGNSSVVLEDKPLGYSKIPLHRISAGEMDGTSLGYSNAFDLCPIQQQLCDIHTALSTAIRAHGISNVWVPVGSRISESNFTEGLQLIEGVGGLGNAKPELINLLELQPEMFQYVSFLLQRMGSIVGINGSARGSDPSDSGSALAMSSALATQNNAKFQANYAQMLENVGTSILELLKEYAHSPRLIEIAGNDSKVYMQEFVGTDISSVTKTVADIGNPITKTPQGRMQMAQLFIQTGKTDPAMLAEIIQSGRLEPMSDTTEDEQIRILVENENLMNNIQIVVMPTDDDEAHVQQHSSVIKQIIDEVGAVKVANDPRYKAAMAHITQHVSNLEDPNLLSMKQALGLPTLAGGPPQEGPPPPHGGQTPPGVGPAGGPPAKPAGAPGAPKGPQAGSPPSLPSIPGSGPGTPRTQFNAGMPPPSGA